MISVDVALGHLFDLVQPTGHETVSLRNAADRVLIEPVTAERDQPPFAASAMDGYAIRAQDNIPGARLEVVGESAAGRRYFGVVEPGQAVRIFTGAPLPEGADHVVIQENVDREGDEIVLRSDLGDRNYIRPAGGDFKAGHRIEAPCRLRPADLSLLAAMNAAEVSVSRKPDIAVLATGDELVVPGQTPKPDQIIASNAIGLAALLASAGASPRILPIARDTSDSLAAAIGLAEGADMLVTIGGASVGDHDLVGDALATAGMTPAFYKVAMRPGKPLLAGALKSTAVVGLPGNPVSTLVCGEVFLRPMVEAMLGLPRSPRTRRLVPLKEPIDQNGPREHYMRAVADTAGVAPLSRQDSSLLSVLVRANSLIVRPPDAPALKAGDAVEVIDLTQAN